MLPGRASGPPEVSVQVTNLQGSANSVVTFGTEEFSPGNLLKQDIEKWAKVVKDSGAKID